MFANDSSFPNGRPPPGLLLAARGYGASGDKSGGLGADARTVALPAGAHLARLHDGSRPFGPWWFTPFEYRRISDHFGLSGAGLVSGRSTGDSALHAALALLSGWYADRSDQIARFTLIRLRAPFHALHGTGDPAITRTGRSVGAVLPGGGARQVFLPDLDFHRDSFDVVVSLGIADHDLDRALGRLAGARLPFE